MIRKNIFSLVLAVSLLVGVTYGQNGHGSHTAGTIGAVGNNGVPSGSGGGDLLIGSVESQIIQICTAAAQMAATQRPVLLVIPTRENF